MENNKHRIVFLGDTHGYWDDFAKQQEIIEEVKSDIVLSEQLQDQILDSPQAYRRFHKRSLFSAFVKHEEIQRLVGYCETKKIKLIGIDFHDFGFDESLHDVIAGITTPTPEQERRLNDILTRRQAHHITVIKKHLPTTTKPLVVLVGTWHLQEDMPLRTAFPEALVIYPCDKDGAMLVQPSGEHLPVRYCTISVTPGDSLRPSPQ